jgi:transcriptional regulator GlxA family with amidase domain
MRASEKQRKDRQKVRLNKLQQDLELLHQQPLVRLSLSELVAIWRRTIEGLFDERDEEPNPRRKASLEQLAWDILHSKEAIEMRAIADRHLRARGVEVLR